MKTGLLAFAFLLLALTPLSAQAPRRVVTVNLCLDQLALQLTAPGQLVGVSYLSHDPGLSVLADRARAVPSVRARVESILDLQPDLVILDSMHGNLKRLLESAGVPILELPWAASLKEAEVLIARMAGALGRDTEGRALVDIMRAELRPLEWRGAALGTAVVLQANHGTSGKGSLMDELLRLRGFRNLAAELGTPAYGRLSLEQVLAGQPDLLVVDGAANAHPARATEFIDSHVLASLTSHTRRLSIPLKYSVCAGPENVEAMRLLATARP